MAKRGEYNDEDAETKEERESRVTEMLDRAKRVRPAATKKRPFGKSTRGAHKKR